MMELFERFGTIINFFVIIAALVAFGVTLRMLFVGLKEEISDLKRWKEEHERESAVARGKYDGEIGLLATKLAVGDNQFKQVARDIVEIKRDIRFLTTRRREDRDENEEPRP